MVSSDKNKSASNQEPKAAKAAKSDQGGAVKKAEKAKDAKKPAKKNGKPGFTERARTYFKGVRSEVKRVVWPSKPEMVKYTGAVVGMLIFFGVLIAIVDAVIVPVLYAYSGLR